MAKRKAIEAAVEAGWDAYIDGVCEDDETMLEGMDRLANVAADHAYEVGRIAGLREAARIVTDVEEEVTLRDYANALAKKARSKK